MAVVKEVSIGDKQIRFMASARTPRIYRQTTGRDIMVDMKSLSDRFNAAKDSNEQLRAIDLTVFEDLAYVMAKQADVTIPDTADDWLDEFDTFDIYEIFPSLMDLWNTNKAGLSVAKKK